MPASIGHTALFVLAPRKPKWNYVEPANGTTRVGFTPFDAGSLTLVAINKQREEYQHCYHHYRSHDGIGLETPISDYQQLMLVT